VQLAPNNRDAQYSLARALAKTGQPGEALQHYREATRLDPADAEAHFRVGLMLVDLHRDAEAVTAFAEAIRLRPDFAAAVFNLALAYRTLGRLNDAREQQRVLATMDANLARQLNSLLDGKIES
jgi:tetratricopeptide (TPR) repeat protein